MYQSDLPSFLANLVCAEFDFSLVKLLKFLPVTLGKVSIRIA